MYTLALLLVLAAPTADEPVDKIAFGSCARQGEPQPIWEAIVAEEPDLFLFIGDNIYGDSDDMAVLKAKWRQLDAEPGFRKLRAACPLLATWDDHDYGRNDAGADYPHREASQQVFLDWLGEPADTQRRTTPGVYDAKLFGPAGKRTQVILLDTRYFRGPLERGAEQQDPAAGRPGPYVPNDDPNATMLGDAQWKWLEQQLRQPADLRIVASSIQVIPNEHRYEKWGNLPLERQRLFRTIRDSGAGGVVFISGDRHHAEISRLDDAVGYPLYDLTSSSLNQPTRWRNERNEHRVGVVYNGANYGSIEVDWDAKSPVLEFAIRDVDGEAVLTERVRLDELRP